MLQADSQQEETPAALERECCIKFAAGREGPGDIQSGRGEALWQMVDFGSIGGTCTFRQAVSRFVSLVRHPCGFYSCLEARPEQEVDPVQVAIQGRDAALGHDDAMYVVYAHHQQQPHHIPGLLCVVIATRLAPGHKTSLCTRVHMIYLCTHMAWSSQIWWWLHNCITRLVAILKQWTMVSFPVLVHHAPWKQCCYSIKFAALL